MLASKKYVVRRHADEDQCKSDEGRRSVVDERVGDEPDHCGDEDRRDERITERAIGTWQLRPQSSQPEDRRDAERVEGPDRQHEYAREPLETLTEHQHDPEDRRQE